MKLEGGLPLLLPPIEKIQQALYKADVDFGRITENREIFIGNEVG